MNDVVICDTNAAIHLAIICPDVLRKQDPRCKIIIHPIVKQEISKLLLDADKERRLGAILRLILDEVPTDMKVALPSKNIEIQQHQRIKRFESGLSPELLSSSSSHQDRCFLIIARTHKVKLLTNEKTLYTIGIAFLGSDRTWRTSNALEALLNLQIIDAITVQQGLILLNKHQERLHVECRERLEELGFTN